MHDIPRIFDSVHLKLIASVSMLADHICAIFFSYLPSSFILRLTIGRIAMPVYLFLLGEGFFHSRNRKRYGISLLITAVISEPVYDISLHGSIWNPQYQNVCFTLFTGFLMLCLLNMLTLKNRQILHLPVIAVFCVITYFLHFSYDYSAMIALAAIYYLHWHKSYIKGCSVCAAIAVFENTPGAFLAAFPLSFYNGKRRRINPFVKYLFYAFYPAHLLILYIINILLK